MSAFANDDVIVQYDIEALARLCHSAGDIDVSPAGRRIPARVIVDHDNRGAAKFEASPHDFPNIDSRLVDRAVAHDFLPDKAMTRAEMEDLDALETQMRKRKVEIVQQCLRAGQMRVLQRVAHQREGQRMPDVREKRGDLRISCEGSAHANGRSRKRRAERSEFGDQSIGAMAGCGVAERREKSLHGFTACVRVRRQCEIVAIIRIV